jgi:hypothetical protein
MQTRFTEEKGKEELVVRSDIRIRYVYVCGGEMGPRKENGEKNGGAAAAHMLFWAIWAVCRDVLCFALLCCTLCYVLASLDYSSLLV